MPKFDWYQGTIRRHKLEHIGENMQALVPMSDIVPCKPISPYLHGAAIKRGEITHATIFHGNNPGIHVKATGEHARTFAPLFQELGVRPSRVDVCEDITEAGLFDKLANVGAELAIRRNVRIEHAGDWSRGHGRTIYFGSQQGQWRLVIYEKGIKEEQDPNWIRIEARYYPHTRSRDDLVELNPTEWLGTKPFIVDFLQLIGWGHIQKNAIAEPWTEPQIEKSRRHLCRQYGKVLAAWADELGSWEGLGQQLRTTIEQPQKETPNHQHHAPAKDFA